MMITVDTNFDFVNEYFMAMSDEDYRMTELAANLFYQYGDRSLLIKASQKLDIDPQVILNWW